MFARAITIGVAVLLIGAAPVVAQTRMPSSESEQRMLWAAATDYARLRDSLWASAPKPGMPSKARITFGHERSDLSKAAEAILDKKVEVLRAHPEMRIVIVGFAGAPGTPAYNPALSTRRAAAAQAYLVARGVDPMRIEIASDGTRSSRSLQIEIKGETRE